MMKRAMFLILAGMLCASVALAGKKGQQTFTLNGKSAGAGFLGANLTSESGASGYLNVNIEPEPLHDGSWSYYADISWNDGISSGDICGHVPASVIKGGVGGPITVNFTYNSFIDLDACSNYPTEFSSLTGTFTLYTGPLSSKHSSTGNYTETKTLPDGTREIERSFKGMRTQESASFQGTFGDNHGSFTVAVDGSSGVAEISVEVGTATVSLVGIVM